MSQFVHLGCGGIVVAGFDLKIKVVTFTVSDKDLVPGATELVADKGKSLGEYAQVSFSCSKCGKLLDVEKEMGIHCKVCLHFHPISEAISTIYTPFVGRDCFEELAKKLGIPTAARKTLLSTLIAPRHVRIN
jgi:hypothetical protein